MTVVIVALLLWIADRRCAQCSIGACADQKQVSYVTSRMAIVNAMHDGLRQQMHALESKVTNGNHYDAKLLEVAV